MKLFSGTVLSIIFFLISLIHFYWVAGGKKGLKQVIPNLKGDETEINFNLGWKIATIVVAIFFLTIASLILVIIFNLSSIMYLESNTNQTRFFLGLALLFLLRSIGDFKYVGLTKKNNNTEFAKWDSRLFIPLCAGIAILSFISSFW